MISVIIPIYNAQKYLSKCLDSVVNQSYSELEIILVDDGSTDESGKICDEYAMNDKRIKVIHKKNAGLVAARKTGLMASTSKYIAYVDADDWIEPNMMERMYSIMVQEDVDIVMCGRYEDTENLCRSVFHGFREGRYDKEELIRLIYPNMICNGGFFEWGILPNLWDKLYKRECLEEFQMNVDDRLTMGEDAACVYPTILNANSIYIMHECLYHYRQSSLSMVKQASDIYLTRKRFEALYCSVRRSFEEYKHIYDLREQWIEYMLFLMIPRAEQLYDGIEKLDYLFPFSEVMKGSNIILYGMGTYGQLLYRYLEHSKFVNVVSCVDRNYKELAKQGLPVESVDNIENINCDMIVIASSFMKVRNTIYNDLVKRYPDKRIITWDEKIVKNKDTLKALRLI